MKAVILAGGKGTRLSEETILKPKPMVEIGYMPILWHIMKIYSFYGVNEFVICCGYKASAIKEYFSNYFLHRSDVTFDMEHNKMEVHKKHAEPWKVTLVYTGLDTATGGRLKRVQDYVGKETFCMTYGDGLSNVNIKDLIAFHKKQGKLVTVTAMRHKHRFGVLHIRDNQVIKFSEKPVDEADWMNSGFFVMEPKFLDYIEGDEDVLEQKPMEKLVKDDQLAAYKHDGFFQAMDSLREKMLLEDLWHAGKAPWHVW